MSRSFQKIRVTNSADNAVVTLTLHNPDRRNAIGPQMSNELLYALGDAQQSETVRVIVLTGEGKAFCSGGDFAEITSGGGVSGLPFKGDYADLLLALVRAEKPVIARVNGHAMGGGLGLVAACTFAIASADVQVGTPEIHVGLFPMMIMAVLARIVPRRRLLQMMLLGEKLTVEEARVMGLVGKVVPAGQLDAEVSVLAAELVSKSPTAMRLGLRAFAAQDDLDLDRALPMLRDRLAECLGTDDAREGLMAFLEKRPPRWSAASVETAK
jgi:enoyl-CoA hydratase/carnithine racemase